MNNKRRERERESDDVSLLICRRDALDGEFTHPRILFVNSLVITYYYICYKAAMYRKRRILLFAAAFPGNADFFWQSSCERSRYHEGMLLYAAGTIHRCVILNGKII